MSALGDTIRIRREKLGLGQDGMASELAVSQQTVSRWELGRCQPRPGRVAPLAALLQLTPDELLRLAGYLPAADRVAAADPRALLRAELSQLTRAELACLLERVQDELLRRGAAGR